MEAITIYEYEVVIAATNYCERYNYQTYIDEEVKVK